MCIERRVSSVHRDGSYLTKCSWDKICTCLIVAHEPKSKTIVEIQKSKSKAENEVSMVENTARTVVETTGRQTERERGIERRRRRRKRWFLGRE